MKRKNLIAARIKHCGSQQVLADMMPVSRTEISYWENARTTPQPHWQFRLCEVLHHEDPAVLLKIDSTDTEEPEPTEQSPAGPNETTTAEDDSVEEEENSISLVPRVQISLSVPSAIQDFIASNITTHLLQIAHTDYPTPDDMTNAIQCALKDFEMTNNHAPDYEITRRKAICELASVPLIALGRNQTLSSRRYEEMLRYCTAALEACWELYEAVIPSARSMLLTVSCTYIPLYLRPSPTIQATTANRRLILAAQYALLQTMLGWSVHGCQGDRSLCTKRAFT